MVLTIWCSARLIFKPSFSVFLSVHNYINTFIVIMDQAADEHNQLVSDDDDDKQFNIHIKN
jgi:hypothetical protein